MEINTFGFTVVSDSILTDLNELAKSYAREINTFGFTVESDISNVLNEVSPINAIHDENCDPLVTKTLIGNRALNSTQPHTTIKNPPQNFSDNLTGIYRNSSIRIKHLSGRKRYLFHQ